MSTSLVGIFYIVEILYILLMSKRENAFQNLLFLCILSEIFIEIGYIIKINEWIFSVTRFIEDVLGFYCLLNLKRISSQMLLRWVRLSFFYIFPIIMLIIFPSDILVATTDVQWDDILLTGANPEKPHITIGGITTTGRFILYALIVLYIQQTFNYQKYKELLLRVYKACTLFIAIGIFEFVFKNIFGHNELWGDTMELIFGTAGDVVLAGREKSSTYELCLFSKESSHYAYILMLEAVIVFTNNVILKNRIFSIWLIAVILLQFLTTAFSSILYTTGFLVLLIIYRWSIIKPATIKIEKTCLVVIILSLTTAGVAFLNSENAVILRFYNLVTNFSEFASTDWASAANNLDDASTQIRFMSVIQTFIAFLHRPLFGFSILAILCHGATVMFLASVGIFGFYAWVKYYFHYLTKIEIFNVNRMAYSWAVVIYFMVNILNSTSLRPYYELTPFMMSICFIYIFGNRDNIKNIKSKIIKA